MQPVKPVFLSEAFHERTADDEHAYHARWIGPRDETTVDIDEPDMVNPAWILPERPEPGNEDWVLVVMKKNEGKK